MEINIDPQVEKFLKSLQGPTVAKTLRTIDLLELFGHKLGMPHSKKISKELFELRVRGQQEIRIIYCFINNQAYLLCGLIKKSQRLPLNDLRQAKAKFNRLNI